MSAYLHSFAHQLPEPVVTNEDLARLTGKEPGWILKSSGIRTRRWAGEETSAVDLAVAAAKGSLKRAGLAAASIGMLLVASGSEASGFPGPAGEIAQRLELETAPAIDLPIASAGSLFGLVLAADATARHEHVLVIATEKMSPLIAPGGANGNGGLDPNTAILFGDGAGAALVSRERPRAGHALKFVDAVLHSDGQFQNALTYRPALHTTLQMNGLSVIMQAVRKLPRVIEEVLEARELTTADVGMLLCHQANRNLLERVARSLGMPFEKVFVNVDRYGNTSSASLLIAASEWMADPATRDITDPVVLASFGAGFHWGAVLTEPIA